VVSCRSKLANMWFAYDLQRRNPGLTVPVLHPGLQKRHPQNLPVLTLCTSSLFYLLPLVQGERGRGPKTTLENLAEACVAENFEVIAGVIKTKMAEGAPW